ncbi:MAG TPA: FUSC family protein, partial [Candidatus Methylomirabilis sp.]|nr:FUSC family protein [Candidatus Methylomirabilis sp.]
MLGTILGILGVTMGCGLLLLTYVCFADLTWLRVLLVPAYIALGLFLNRILTLGPLGSAMGLPLALGMVVPDVIPSTEFLTRFPFYVWWAAVLGLSVNLAVQYLLNPDRAQSVLVRGLSARLQAVETVLLSLAGEAGRRTSRSLRELAIEGAAEQLHLLKLASAAEPFLKHHHARVAAQIILVDRLVTAASLLEEQGVQLPNEAIETRLRRIAAAAAAWREAILVRRWPKLQEPPPHPDPLPLGGGEGEPQASRASPMLLEMERVLHLVSEAGASGGLPDELRCFPMAPKGGAVVADAFRNPAYIHFAIKGALAGFICYLIFTLTAYQGIYTSVVTCVVCSLSTIGASVQKGVLRLAGSAVGGLLGVITLTCIFPYLDSIGGFWVPFAAVTGL